ncbi:right-handed parallel beta-helix repeat-containing protein [Filomicrobium sp.]|uniref:right-handed parallel beta-helix repeat-containing protein n=1 Tax=Filomicrobium sp. TaxID=2024831 RepID=UPI00258CE8BB|nr:right-handed parallel beta-helix repeat-containing protein [Filomicrobium sp.]MCV0371679.1 right-handed parallel beta-helix repeat-containing protein [Filomicrobium sp.]
MSIFSKLGALIFAPTDAAGNPRQVINHDAQVWSTEVERIIQVALEGGDLLVYGSLTALNADLDHPAHTGAILIGESIADDGLYMKQGASGSGSWVKIGNVPGQGFVKATNAGAGTANAIAATAPVAVNETQLILLPITAANTASPVTVAFNGGAALTVKTVSGNDVAAGGLPAGSVMLGVVQGGDFRLLSDQASAGIQAAAEAAQIAAEAALAEMREKSVGAFPDNASADAFLTAEGLTKQKGTIYFNTTADVWRYWDGSAWQTFPYAIVADGGVTRAKIGADLSPSIPLNVKEFGAAGDGVTDDAAAINLALDGGDKHVYFPAGEYVVGSPVRLFANTRITFHPNASVLITGDSLFVNGEIGNAAYAAGYNGDGNIHIDGGTYNVSLPRPPGSNQTAFIQFAHAENILVENCRFESLWRGHCMDLCAIRKGRVRNCYFGGQVLDVGDSGREAINIDFAYASGFPLFGAYDDTVCDDLIIENCHSDGMQVLAGSHGSTVPPTKPRGIKIINNSIKNSVQYAIWGRYWDGAQVVGNDIDGVGEQAVFLSECERSDVTGNHIKDAGNIAPNHAIQLTSCSATRVVRNVIEGATHLYGVRAFGGSGNVISTERVGAGTDGVFNVTEPTSTVDGILSNTVDDDDVWIVAVPEIYTQGMVVVTTQSASSACTRAFLWYRVASSGALDVIAQPSGATSAVTTGPLTGTTGADGKMTVSAHSDGNLYIENRFGAARNVEVQFMAGGGG